MSRVEGVAGAGALPAAWKGLDPDVLVGAGVTYDAGLVRIPYRLRGGDFWNAKIFARNGRSWWERAGLPLLPFGLERLPERRRPTDKLLICEGESDALSARSFYREYDGYFVLGLPGAYSWCPAWARFVREFDAIGVLGDGDSPGRAMAWRVRRDVPHARPVELPDGEDVRSLLQRDGRAKLDERLARADWDALLGWALDRAETLAEFEHLLGVS